MIHRISSELSLAQALRLEGFELPKECADVRLLAPVDGIWQLELKINLFSEDLEKVGKAITRVGVYNK